jgi:flagellar protein FlgJ
MASPLAIDPSNLNSLKRLSRDSSPEALKAAAQQFEAIFMNMVMKSLRAAGAQQGADSSDQERLFRSMLDQQFAQQFSTRGTLGLAKIIETQLGRHVQAQNQSAGAQVPAQLPLQPTLPK